VIVSVLGARGAVQIYQDLQAQLAGPLYCSDEVGILAGNIGLVVTDVHGPVADRDANGV
jgi:hypothetical protein